MSADLPRIPRPYQSIIATFSEAGGAGNLNHHGQITCGPTKHPMPGDAVTWLTLVSLGYAAGEDGKIFLTDLGQEVAAAIIAGRVKGTV